MNIEDQKVLYHISKVVEKQATTLEQMQREIHIINLDIQSIRSEGGMVPNRELKTKRIKDASLGGTVGAIIISLITYLMQHLGIKL